MTTADLVFQTIDWHEADDPGLVVTAFGRTADGDVVHLALHGFKPSFLLRIDKPSDVQRFSKHVRDVCRTFEGSGAVGKLVQRREFMFYSTGTKTFMEVEFPSIAEFTRARGKFLRDASLKARIYDSKNPPFLQLIHTMDLSTSGWLRAAGAVLEDDDGYRRCYRARWDAVARVDEPPVPMAPFLVAAFDIECTSSHGDFPVPVKGYEKTARELVIWAGEQMHAHPKEKVFDDMEDAFLAIFEDDETRGERPRLLSKVYPKSAKASVQEAVYRKYIENDAHNIIGSKLSNTEKIERLAELLNKCALDRALPALRGDEMIQIGLTVNRIGSREVEKHVFVFGGCAPVPDAHVYSYATEEAMLRGFVKTFLELDPDIVTGYNIMGFDFVYIYRRAQELSKLLAADLELGRIRPERTPRNGVFVEQRLSSSAMGDNDLTYLSMPGRLLFDLMKLVQRDHKLDSYTLNTVAKHFIGDAKDDISPGDIFRLHAGNDEDRAIVAKYCAQDCALCNLLCEKLCAATGAFGMAEVCKVPTTWIFLRGQGAKALSLVSVACRRDGYAIPVLGGVQGASKFQGALVLEPETGVYMDDPVVVLDFASLYPSSMIASDLSHDTLLPPGDEGQALKRALCLETRRVDFELTDENGVTSARVAEFVQTESKGILPRILQNLLQQRKATRAKIKLCDDPFERGVLDGLQLAYKLTANSLYGQLGAYTSPICCVDIAASTTATGRAHITKLRDFVENDFGGQCVYGDTDSCFMTFADLCVDSDGRKLKGKAAIAKCIELGKECSAAFQPLLDHPHSAEYEKTFYPFILLSKKRYVGLKYETSADEDAPTSSMGIVMKRRDNALLVRDVYGGVLDRILKERDVRGAAKFVTDSLMALVRGETPVEKLIVSKTLRGTYVNPGSIVHAALAKRMRERDPGSAPAINDRVPFVFIVHPNKKAIQAERVEHPDHLEAQGAVIDYGHYITNQLQEPLKQLFSLVVEQIPGARRVPKEGRDKEVMRLMFQPALDAIKRRDGGMRDMSSYFGAMGM